MPLYKMYSTSPNRPTAISRGAVRARVASPGNVTIAAPGATVNGVTMADDEEFLAVNQSTPAEDGLYVFNGAATPATRSDALPVGVGARGVQVIVEEGTYADKLFVCTNDDGADVVGTDNLVFREQLAASRKIIPFGLPNVAAGDDATPASSTPVQLGWCGVTTIVHGWVAPRAGFVSALSIGLTGAPGGSDLIAGVYMNGSLISGSEVTSANGGDPANGAVFADYTLSFEEGAVLDVRIKTGTGWSATTVDLAAGLEVTY